MDASSCRNIDRPKALAGTQERRHPLAFGIAATSRHISLSLAQPLHFALCKGVERYSGGDPDDGRYVARTELVARRAA